MHKSLNGQKPNRKREQSAWAKDDFETLYTQYADQVYRKCLSMTKDSEDAQDFTQEIFIKVFSKLDTFKQQSAPSTWLYSIAHNYCLDQIRISKRMNLQGLPEGVELVEEPAVSDELQLQALERLMENLPVEEVTLLRLKYEQGLSVSQIGRQLNLNESAIKMRLKRTRDKLNRLINQRML
ncbi:RNA polymerase sigma factor [Spirosoma endbachense]|uniref:Sigma-70 family RNA polymerase sigma factor n=1 Tax=Spirosoma endbachense TaxID=2666025 RepID=A0A6P1VQ92_9BACT|nr:sigma-70 family RNA polymerase sigma factor [Spirosoma endbachense]QHV93769.1 sigma-70 family RNA polymerase sigma factor [Spirosoma endbachense]